MTDEQNPTTEPAVEPQAVPDNVVSMSAHVLARSGLLEAHKKPEPVQEAPAEDAQDANEAQPSRPSLRALTPAEIAGLMAQAARSGSNRTRRAAIGKLGDQVTQLQRALLEFRAHVQRAMMRVVSVEDAALAVIRAHGDGMSQVPFTQGELRIQAQVNAILEKMKPAESAPAAETGDEPLSQKIDAPAPAEEPQS